MNWSNAKTMLIVLFLAANLFLLINIINSAHKSDAIMPEIMTSTVDILKNNGITIDKSMIPQKNISVPYAEAENAVSDYLEFSEKLLGKNITKYAEDTYKSNVGEIKFSGDYFSYKAADSNEKSTDITQKDAITISSQFLKNCGIDLSSAKSSVQQGSGNYIVTFSSRINSMPFFTSSVTVTVQGNKVVSMDGCWFNKTSKNVTSITLKSVTGVLIDFISLPGRTQGQVEISDLTLGYYIPETNKYHKSLVLIPAWQISLTDGTSYCIDSRNPE